MSAKLVIIFIKYYIISKLVAGLTYYNNKKPNMQYFMFYNIN